MDKQHIVNIQNFIERKIQKARNQVDNNCPELAAETLREVENDIRTAMQVELLSNSFYRATSKIEGIRVLIDRLRRMDEETTDRLNNNEALHQLLGVDGWQELAADAPSEEQIKQEMVEDDEGERRIV